MKKKVIYNITASLALEVVSVICAFILPRMIISNFGSEYNGIVSSVTQFLSVVTLLRGGVGGVTRAALYKPLADNDTNKISAILNSTEHFMRKIAIVFVVLLFAFATVYPFLVRENFGWLFTFSLVLILGISTIAQYYFGITYQFLLIADQKSYVYSILQTIATILNTIFSAVLITLGVEFRLVKLISALVFAAIPIVMYIYVRQNYKIDKTVPREDSYIKQRWDAFAHQTASFVHSNTDLVLLTLFSDLYQVSVYSVYFMVVNGVKKFVLVFSSGLEASLGKMIATNEQKKLVDSVSLYEWAINVISISVFISASLLIAPFMKVYTMGIDDANYIQPMLGYLLCLGAFLSCVRLPYQNLVEAAGHFKSTKRGAITEATINICVSLILVCPFGSIGVAIGTVVAMAFRTIQYAMYAARNILYVSYLEFIKRFIVTIINFLIILVPFLVFNINEIMLAKCDDFAIWISQSLIVFSSVTIITIVINVFTYSEVVKRIGGILIKSRK